MNIIEAMKIMDLEPGFSQSELNARWRELARMYHPDINGCPEAKQRFIDAQKAYKFLNARFFGMLRGANQDCLDQLSREAFKGTKKHAHRRWRLANQCRDAVRSSECGPDNCRKVNLLMLLLLVILAALYMAQRSSWIHQGMYDLQIDIACISSMLGAFLVSFSSLVKARLLVR